MNIPDGLPQLVEYKSPSPARGGCIMQVVSYLTEGGWRDRPSCVHPLLRDWAIAVNDSVDDEERQRLWKLIPSLINTDIPISSMSSDEVKKMRHWCKEFTSILNLVEEYSDRNELDRMRRLMKSSFTVAKLEYVIKRFYEHFGYYLDARDDNINVESVCEVMYA